MVNLLVRDGTWSFFLIIGSFKHLVYSMVVIDARTAGTWIRCGIAWAIIDDPEGTAGVVLNGCAGLHNAH